MFQEDKSNCSSQSENGDEKREDKCERCYSESRSKNLSAIIVCKTCKQTEVKSREVEGKIKRIRQIKFSNLCIFCAQSHLKGGHQVEGSLNKRKPPQNPLTFARLQLNLEYIPTQKRKKPK